MKTNKWNYFQLIVLLSFSLFLLQGCVVAAVGAGIAAVKYGNSKKAAAKAQNQTAYNQYVLGMQKINLERQKAGLKPQPISTYEEYSRDTSY